MRRIIRTLVAPLLALGFAQSALAEERLPLVDAAWLKGRLADPALVVVDIRSGEKDAGRASFEQGHVPGARHADYGSAGWRENHNGTGVYLPSPAAFERLAGSLGISNQSRVVIVHAGLEPTDFGAAARIYWTFKAMGHAPVSILDGGHAAWVAAGGAIETGPSPAVEPASFVARYDARLRATAADAVAASNGGATLLDSRPTDFFSGKTSHKAIAAKGHIPGAINVPHDSGFVAANRLADREKLEQAYSSVKPDEETVVYCNTGHWAATNWFILSEVLGRKDVRLYEGSMLDYTRDATRPVTTAAP